MALINSFEAGVRPATKQDSINLAALSIQVWLHAYARDGIRTGLSEFVFSTFTQNYFDGLLDNPDFHILVCVCNDHLVGYIAVNMTAVFESNVEFNNSNSQDSGYEVDTLYVQEHFKGKGIGKRLLHEAQGYYGEKLWLSTWVHNFEAIAFYKHLGFNDIGEVYFELEGERHENRVLALNSLVT